MDPDINLRSEALKLAIAHKGSLSLNHLLKIASEFEKYLQEGYTEPPKPERAKVWTPSTDELGHSNLIKLGSADIFPGSKGLDIDLKLIIAEGMINHLEDGERIALPPIFIDYKENN